MYDWTNPALTLNQIKTNILTKMKMEEDWYMRHRKKNGLITRGFRFIALMLFAVGTLCPIIVSLFKTTDNWLQWGYISLAVGGLFILFDKYFGLSSNFVRFYLAKLDIKKNTFEFEENWELEIVKLTTTSPQK